MCRNMQSVKKVTKNGSMIEPIPWSRVRLHGSQIFEIQSGLGFGTTVKRFFVSSLFGNSEALYGQRQPRVLAL